MKTLSRLACVLGAAATLACGGPDEGALGKVSSKLRIPDSGFIPYPVKVPDGGVDPEPSWDGTLAELMAADAYAQCGGALAPEFLWHWSDTTDEFLAYLEDKMGDAMCGTPATLPIPYKYRSSRQVHPECNVDPITGEQTTLKPIQVDDAAYELPTLAELGIAPYAVPPELGEPLWTEARLELQVATLNLCMAQRLREHLATADGLFLTSEDHLQLLNIIRERTQIAMIQYALLGEAFSADTDYQFAMTHELMFLPVLRAWSAHASDDYKRVLGSDFAAAIKLHTETVQELGRALLRAEYPVDAGKSLVTRTWGANSGRDRLLRLMYGGDPQADVQSAALELEDTRDAHVEVLFGLAREADAFRFRAEGSADGSKLPLVLDPTVESLYKRVEAKLRSDTCEGQTPGDPACDISWDDPEIPDLDSYRDYELYQRFSVTPEHAISLAKKIYQALPAVTSAGSTNPAFGRWHFTGVHDADLVDAGPGEIAGWIHLDPEFGIAPLAVGARQRELLGEWRLNMPEPGHPLWLHRNPRELGFVARLKKNVTNMPGFKAESMRWAGAMTALAAVRNSIYSGMAGHFDADAYYAPVAHALPLISAAIGTSVSALPKNDATFTGTTQDQCRTWANPDAPTTCSVTAASAAGNSYATQVVSIIGEGLDEWTPRAGAYARGQVEAALDPDHEDFSGATRQLLLDSLSAYSTPTVEDLGGGLQRRTYAKMMDRVSTPYYAVFLKKGTGVEATYLPLVPHTYRAVEVWASQFVLAFDGLHLGLGGYLTDMVERAWAVHRQNWASPRYDAFGLPIDWTPPTEPGVIGAETGETAVQYYLRRAKTASSEATAAAQQSVDQLMSEAQDASGATQATSREKGALVDELTQRAFCGDKQPDCTVEFGTGVVPYWACESLGDPLVQDWCVGAQLFPTFVEPAVRRFLLAMDVADRVNLTGEAADPLHPPTFDQYAGGQLQGLLVDQWRAVEAYVGAMKSFGEFAEASFQSLMVAWATLQSATSSDAYFCDGKLMVQAWQESYSAPGDHHDWGLDVDTFFQPIDDPTAIHIQYWVGHEDAISLNPAPLRAALTACIQARLSLPPTEFQYAGVMAGVFSQLADRSQVLLDRANEITQSTIAVQQAYQQYKLARERTQLEYGLAETPVQTKFGVQRRFHSYDVWRARALLENARRLAVAARRAIEARFVVDLSTMTAPEPFVQAPALWADDVYAPDLNVPSAVGLSVRPESKAGGTGVVNRLENVYVNRVEDYVNNLELFVDGYSVWRPTAVATADAEVLSFDGPEVTEDVTLECPEPPPSPVCTDSGTCLHVRSWAASDSASQQDDTIRPEWLLVNSGSSPIPLSEVTLRYWFTVDTTSPITLVSNCDYFSVNPGGCTYVQRSFGTVSPALATADRYLEVSFSASAGTLYPGNSVEVKLRIHKDDYLHDFNELNDYSYDPRPSYAPTTLVSLYRSGALSWGTDPTTPPEPPCEPETGAALSDGAGLWSFYCEAIGQWIIHPGLGELPLTSTLAAACDGELPQLARLTFALDPWGRDFGDVFQPPMDARHNARWRRLAVNLVGTGIRDCSQSSDPEACYTESFVRYDLDHSGREWVTDYDEAWHMLGLPIATIESAKALAVEEWLDPVSHGWALPMVQVVGRGELQGRPLGGDYSITFEITPDMRLDRIERVQILTEADYWVRQEY